MKKLLLIAVLLLTGCGSQTVACEDQDDRTLQWKGIEYTLPACWSKSESTTALVLRSADETGEITMTFDATQIDVLKTPTGGSKELINQKGETIYVINADGSNDEARAIFSSAEMALLNIAGGSCEVPDYTYPQAYTEYWNGYQFSLPWCWSAKEAEDGSVHMAPGDNDSGEIEVNFFISADMIDSTQGEPIKFGDDFYVTAIGLDDPNVELILSSITKL
jgi:hypothetical protein